MIRDHRELFGCESAQNSLERRVNLTGLPENLLEEVKCSGKGFIEESSLAQKGTKSVRVRGYFVAGLSILVGNSRLDGARQATDTAPTWSYKWLKECPHKVMVECEKVSVGQESVRLMLPYFLPFGIDAQCKGCCADAAISGYVQGTLIKAANGAISVYSSSI